MGTRHLICVMKDGDYKVAQYGQWDGYPEGQGSGVLEFLRGKGNINSLKSNLAKVRFLDPEGIDKEFCESYDANAPEWSNEPDNRTQEQKRWFSTYISRDIGSDILTNIATSEDREIVIRNSLDFAKDSLFCEWCYVVDLDKNTFEVFKGFNGSELGQDERFYFDGWKPEDSEFHPVKFLFSLSLDGLPTDQEFQDMFVTGCNVASEENYGVTGHQEPAKDPTAG